MSNFEFVQVNSRNITETVEKINGKNVIGFEVVNPQIIELLQVNIDPQHTGIKQFDRKLQPENKSAALWVLGVLPTIDPNYQTTVVYEKLDIDSLCAMVLWTKADLLSGFENDPEKHETFLEICNRIKSIDEMDCGLGNVSGNEWNPEFYKTQLEKGVTEFNVLGAMCADFKCDINFKRDAMLRWLILGELPEKYQQQQLSEFEKEKEAKIEKINGVICVETTARNAQYLVYSQNPFGVVFNNQFPTPNGTVKKFTVMAFNGKDYLNFTAILADLNEIEQGWGGNLNAGIIGSPFAGTNLSCETVCEIVLRHIL